MHSENNFFHIDLRVTSHSTHYRSFRKQSSFTAKLLAVNSSFYRSNDATNSVVELRDEDGRNLFTARSSYASTVLGIVTLYNSFHLKEMSVHPSITCLLCEEMKEHTAEILIPHKMVINLIL